MKAIERLKKYFNEQGMCSVPKSVKEALNELEELENGRCSDCKDRYNCHIYKHLGDTLRLLVFCSSFKKNK